MNRLGLALAAALLASACTAEGGADAEGDAARPGADGGGSPAAEPAPSATRTAPTPTPSERPTQPVVLAMHATRAPLQVSTRVARRAMAGRLRSWSALGASGGPLRVVAAPGTPAADRLRVDTAAAAVRRVVRDPDVLAVVPAAVVGPTVQAVEVAGTDPISDPASYPLTMPATGQSRPGPVVTMSVVGDIMLGRRVGEIAAAAGDVALQLRPMQHRLAAADITVGNLESTLSDAGAATQGADSFAAPPAVRGGLRDAGFDVLDLANNHLGDYGSRALVRTVRLLREGGFETFGAGRNAQVAREPAVLERSGVQFGLVGFNAIGETPEADSGRPGAVSVSMPPRTGPLDERELGRFLSRVRRLDRRVDVVVVMPHWGTQYTNEPEPIQRRVARRLVDAGADLVVGGHPHWVQGASMVRDRLVVHSLGNFVFDMDFMRETQAGVLLELTYWGSRLMAADLVPYRMDDDFAPRVVSHARGRDILRLMWETSGPAFRPE